MKSWLLLLGLAVAVALPGLPVSGSTEDTPQPIAAEATAESPAPGSESAATAAPTPTETQTPTPSEAPVATPEAPAAPEEPAAAPVAETLGPVGYDAQGRPGRVHRVVAGDTLWDISDAYLGTPWVWPSIWTSNAEIQNPHRIRPGDRIWITPTEMRRVSDAEAEALLAGTPAARDAGGDSPAALDEGAGVPGETLERPIYRYTEIQTTGFVSVEAYTGAATIVDSAVPRVWLTDPDTVEIGFGHGEVAPGDQFEIFRPAERVVHPESGALFGYATDVLGWLEVTEVHDETSSARIRLSRAEIRRGDYLLPRPQRSAEIPVGDRPEVEGLVIHTPSRRHQMASTDVVYLNRGTSHGLAIGSPLEVFRPLGTGFDKLRGDERQLPDHVIAKMIVVDATPEASVAIVTHTSTEINRGDLFRGSDSIR